MLYNTQKPTNSASEPDSSPETELDLFKLGRYEDLSILMQESLIFPVPKAAFSWFPGLNSMNLNL